MEFTLSNNEGFSKIVKSDQDGVVLIKDISYGDYSLKLTKGPEGDIDQEHTTWILSYRKGDNEIYIDERGFYIKDGIVEYHGIAI